MSERGHLGHKIQFCLKLLTIQAVLEVFTIKQRQPFIFRASEDKNILKRNTLKYPKEEDPKRLKKT